MLYQQMREDTFYTMNKLIVLTILVLIPSFGVCASKDKSVDEMPVKASPVGKDKTTVVDSQDINPTTNKPRSKAVELEDLPISIATQAALDLKVNTSAFAINNLTDVDTTGKATGKILKFDASGNLVVGDDLTGSGSGSLPTCTNDEDIAEWDTTTSTWVCRTYDKISQGTWGSITGTLSSQTDLQAALDAKANSTNISFVAGALSDMKILTTAQPSTGENLIDDMVSYGATEDNLRLWSIDKIGSQLATKQASDSDLTTWAGVTPSANGQSLVSAANYAAMRTLLDLEAGTDFNAYDADLTTWAELTPGTGVATAIAANTGAVGGLPMIIASGAYTVDTASISANTCASAVAVTASGVATTDVIIATPNAILSSVTGFGVTTAGAVRVDVYPTSGNVNFQLCNPTGAAIDPGSVTFNWKVIR